MKQILALVVAFSITTTVFSQAGQKWSTSGNANSTGNFIGSTNNEPLVFKTNNTTRGMFTSAGSFQLTSLAGWGVRLLQTDSSGKLLPFPMSNANDVLYGDGTWRPLPTPPPTLWEQNGTSLYYLNGKVGIGTKTPLTNFDVIGDAYISNNLYVGGGIIITEKVRANTEVATAALRADSIMMDSTKAVYGYSVFKDQVRLENKLRVVGNTQIDGDFRVNGDFIFGDNKRIGYLPASGGNPEIISFGKLPNTGVYQLLRSACNFPAAPTSYQVEGMINAYGNSVYGGNLNVLSMGFDGANGIIDMAGTNTQGGPGLLINYYCGKDIFMNTGVNGGNITMTSSTMGMVGIGKYPNYKLDVAGDVSINYNTLYLGDQNHGLRYFQNYANESIDGPVLFGYGGGALAIKQGTLTKNVLTWKQDGNVGIGTNAPMTKLDVNGNSKINGVLEIENNGTEEKWTNNGWNVRLKSPMNSAWVTTTSIIPGNPNSGRYMGIGMTNSGWYFINSNSPSGDVNSPARYPLVVHNDGLLTAREIEITLAGDFGWPDFVFNEEYQLKKLSDLENFIKANKHLPNVPTEKEVKEKGIKLGDMNAVLLQKIEELTLYIIDLEKRLKKVEIEKE